MKTNMSRNHRNIDPIDVQVANMLNDEMDANNHMNNISMIGVVNSTFYTPFKRPRVERNIMSIASYVSAINYDLYGFATPDLITLRDYLKVPQKFVVVSGSKNNRDEEDRQRKERTHHFNGEELILYTLNRFRKGAHLETNIERDCNTFKTRDRSQWSRGFNAFINWYVDNHLSLVEANLEYFIPYLKSSARHICDKINENGQNFPATFFPLSDCFIASIFFWRTAA